MSQLVIIGARSFARETFSYAAEAGFCVKGFLDDEPELLRSLDNYPPILGSVEEYIPDADDVFVCALGDPVWKMKYAEIMLSKGGRFVSVVHPTVYVGHNVRIGNGCVLCPHCTITNDTVLEDHVVVNVNASVSHDNWIGMGATVSPGCSIAGRCTIGRRVFLGVGSTVIPDVKLGDGLYVAAGACVTTSFDSGRVMGVPARLK